MNQQNQGSGSLPSVPMKRKRGRPRKQENVVPAENIPVMPGSDNVLNSNQTAGTTDDCVDEMVGKVVTGVIEGTFNAGYLLNVKVADTDGYLRGLVFQAGQVAPITAENDVAPHIKMIERKEVPFPVLKPRTEIHGSIPSSVQCSKQPLQPELEVHSGVSVSLENQPASTILHAADLSKNETSISSGGILQGVSEPGHESRSTSIMSELDCDKAVERADGGATKDSQPASEPVNAVPTIENTDKQLRIEQQDVPSVHKLNEVIQDEPNTSNIELNQNPVTAEPQSMPSEQTSEPVDNLVAKQASPKIDVKEDTKTELAIETSSKVDTSNSNGRPSTDEAAKILDVGSNRALETIQPQSIPSEQISKSVPSESKVSSEGCDFQEKSDSQDCSTFGELNKVDVNQPSESLVNSVESGNQIGSDIS